MLHHLLIHNRFIIAIRCVQKLLVLVGLCTLTSVIVYARGVGSRIVLSAGVCEMTLSNRHRLLMLSNNDANRMNRTHVAEVCFFISHTIKSHNNCKWE